MDDVGEVGEAAEPTPAFLSAAGELEHHVQHAVTAQAPLGPFGAVADRGEGTLDWIGRSDALPMLGREVVEGQQLVPVLFQAFGGLGVFRLVSLDEEVEPLHRIGAGFGLPDVMEHLPGLGLRQLGQVIQDVARLVDPAPLLPRRGEDLLQCGPEAHCPVTDRQFRRRETAGLEREQHLAPALGGFAHAVVDCEEMLLATGIYADHHEGAEPVLGPTQPAIDTVHPDVDPVIAAQIALTPVGILRCPFRLQPRHRLGREAGCFRPHERLQRRSHFSGRNALEIEPRQCCLDGFSLADIGWDQSGTECDRLVGLRAHLRHSYPHGANTRLHSPFGVMTIANNSSMALKCAFVLELREEAFELGLHGSLQ